MYHSEVVVVADIEGLEIFTHKGCFLGHLLLGSWEIALSKEVLDVKLPDCGVVSVEFNSLSECILNDAVFLD